MPLPGEGFAGMPLPNLPALSPSEAANDTSSAAVEVARGETPSDIAAETSPAATAGAPAGTAAEIELRKAAERTGLNDLQLGRIERARRLIVAGDSAQALEQMQVLNAELDNAAVLYTVAAGDNLWRIAEKPSVYGNAFLWPLIWRANIDRVKEPYQLYKGMKLKVPTNPSVDRVAAALDYARQNSGEGLRPAADAPPPNSGTP
jgi:nucleoid-associated protein YgaU